MQKDHKNTISIQFADLIPLYRFDADLVKIDIKTPATGYVIMDGKGT